MSFTVIYQFKQQLFDTADQLIIAVPIIHTNVLDMHVSHELLMLSSALPSHAAWTKIKTYHRPE